MENTCSQYLFLFLLCLSTSPPPPVEASIDRLRWVHSHPIALTWNDARSYCWSDNGGNGELAIARNALDLIYFSEICGNPSWICWVGFRLKLDNVYIWNNGQNISMVDTPWYAGHPKGYWGGSVYQGQLVDHYSESKLFFLCENNLVLEEEKTWEEALHHCRALEPDTDLLSFHDKAELYFTQDAMARAQMDEVWIGLRWLAGRWLWMDRTASGYISLPECPAAWTHCGTLSGEGQHARNCMEKRRFFCLKRALV